MRIRFVAGLAAVALTATLPMTMTAQKKKHKGVKVDLKSSTGQDAGTVVFRNSPKGVRMVVKLENLPVGEHAVHLHQKGVCDAPDFKTAGGHFNPTMKHHGFENPEGHHAGDTPSSITVGEDHKGEKVFLLTDVSMDPAASNSIYTDGGLSVVVHEKADDQKSDPAGAAGNRIACGVIPAPPAAPTPAAQ